jgi:seryl-tRNA synthetase
MSNRRNYKMIDIKELRSNPDTFKELCKRRRCDINIDEIINVDKQLREINSTLDSLRHEQKKISGIQNKEKAVELKAQIKNFEGEVNVLKNKRDHMMSYIPNLLAPGTPEGKDDSDNVEVSHWGNIPTFDFEPKPHEIIGAELDILDLKRGVNVAKSGFYYWKGDGARMAWAIFSLAFDFLMKRGFTCMFTPILGKERTLFGTGYLPFFKDEIYKLEGDDLCLIGTSEQTLISYHVDEILQSSSLPILYTAFTPCFRVEAGSYGKESRGAFRVHQFHKIEQIVFCRPEESERWHKNCQENAEEFMQLLEIPFRVVRVCIGDLGAPAYKKYDIEGWFSGYNGFRETHSNTNLLDYQTRRLSIRCKEKENKSMFFPHTISATMITDRALLAILENNQQEDGSVTVPNVLRPYLGGQVKIS